MEAKETDNPDASAFSKKKLLKKQRVLQNELRRVDNATRASKAEGGAYKPATHIPTGIPRDMKASESNVAAMTGNMKRKKTRPSEDLQTKVSKLTAAQVSTASMGKVCIVNVFHRRHS